MNSDQAKTLIIIVLAVCLVVSMVAAGYAVTRCEQQIAGRV